MIFTGIMYSIFRQIIALKIIHNLPFSWSFNSQESTERGVCMFFPDELIGFSKFFSFLVKNLAPPYWYELYAEKLSQN